MRSTQFFAAVLVAAISIPALVGCGPRSGTASRVTPGWGVDTVTMRTSWVSAKEERPEPEIYRLWRSYLETRTDPSYVHLNPYWSPEELERWPDYDLTWFLAYRRLFEVSRPSVLEIRPASPGAEDEYVIRSLFSATVGDGPVPEIKPLALTRVYAVREGRRWVLANALPRLTADWRKRQVGPIRYVYPPDHAFDERRARRAVRFADSLAAAFDAPQLDRLTYYVAGSAREAYRIMGFDWVATDGPTGRAFPHNELVISGNRHAGEAHLHELAHMVLEPIAPITDTHPLIHEGVATWTGGTLDMGFPEAWQKFASFARARPELTLDSILGRASPGSELRPAGAILLEMAYRQGGVEAVRSLLEIGPSDDELRRELSHIMELEWQALCEEWRVAATSPSAHGSLASSDSTSSGPGFR